MKTAYTGWMWVNQYVENSEEFRNQFIQCVKELSYLGYDYLENFTFLKRHFTSSEVKKICNQYGVSMSALYCNLSEGLDELKEDAEYTAEMGGKYLICSSQNWPEDQGLDSPADWDAVNKDAFLCNELGAYCKDVGIKLLHNHHSYTTVCRRPEIDAFARQTNPEFVGFCVDDGHAMVAGVNIIQLIKDYADRIEYVHIKDLDLTLSWRGRGMSWVPLGLGTLDLPGFFKALREIEFDGIVCAGLPAGCEKINHFESARLSRLYLRSAQGL